MKHRYIVLCVKDFILGIYEFAFLSLLYKMELTFQEYICNSLGDSGTCLPSACRAFQKGVWNIYLEDSTISKALEESACEFVVRCWNKVTQAFIKYLQFGKYSPLKNISGGVHTIFDRGEIQSQTDGKVPHHHTLIYFCNQPTTQDEIIAILQLIHGSAEKPQFSLPYCVVPTPTLPPPPLPPINATNRRQPGANSACLLRVLLATTVY